MSEGKTLAQTLAAGPPLLCAHPGLVPPAVLLHTTSQAHACDENLRPLEYTLIARAPVATVGLGQALTSIYHWPTRLGSPKTKDLWFHTGILLAQLLSLASPAMHVPR